MSRVAVDTRPLDLVAAAAAKRAVTLKGVRAGVQVLNKAAKAEAPKASGALRTAQGYVAKKGRKGKTLSFAVQGARKNVVKLVRRPGRKSPRKAVPAFYDHLVNLGVRPHSVTTGQRLGRAARVNTKTGRVYGAAVARTDQTGRPHPGAPANPFRRRAWARAATRAGEAALTAMADEVLAQIRKAQIRKGK